MSSTFEPPKIDVYAHLDPRKVRFRKFVRGQTVYRKDNVWATVQEPGWDTIKDADLVPVADRPGGERTDSTDRDRYLFLGGRMYTVSQAVRDALTAAGY